jgi:hypothetical protein
MLEILATLIVLALVLVPGLKHVVGALAWALLGSLSVSPSRSQFPDGLVWGASPREPV